MAIDSAIAQGKLTSASRDPIHSSHCCSAHILHNLSSKRIARCISLYAGRSRRRFPFHLSADSKDLSDPHRKDRAEICCWRGRGEGAPVRGLCDATTTPVHA